jgi:FlaA1/EpsC-like NDP-sugar epimerase
MVDVATALMNGRDVPVVYTGVRPGEKLHEIMVSEEERFRTIERNDYYVIRPILPELRQEEADFQPVLDQEYSSEFDNISLDQLRKLLVEAAGDIELFS